MSLNPLNELKRRLDEETTPLGKRLCLAKNIVLSHHFPTAPKERIIAEWLDCLSKSNKLDVTELQKILEWLNCDDLTGELKINLIQVVSLFVQKNTLETNDIQFIINFLENDKISFQMSQQIDNYMSISITLLKCLKDNDNLQLSQKIFSYLIKYYRDSTKKLEFITKFIVGENLETVFSYLDTDNQNVVKDVCKNILFHVNKKPFFINYLQTMIRKDSLNNLIAEKGDNMQSVLKIMRIFFEFPKHCSGNDTKFLQDFIAVFVSSYKNEGQIIFAFYIMAANVLSLKQDYITSSMDMTPIEMTEKVKRNIFLIMLEILLQNEVDLSVKLTDTFGAKTSKVEIQKNFLSFLQSIMMGQLKLEGKLDKTTLQIIKTALKLDPSLVEQNFELILPPIMTAKKNPSMMESYKEMLNFLLEIQFKLSHGGTFITEILPSLKNYLVSLDTEQIEISSDEKSKSKLITGNDLFPVECVEFYGKLTSDLMFRQNKELLETMQKDLQMYCFSMMDEDTISPSTTILTEVLSALFSSFLHHNKMADHIVPEYIAEEFWNSYSGFEHNGLRKFGLTVLKFRGNTPLIVSFLNVCQSYAQLKLLNINYSNYKLEVGCTSAVFDLSGIMKCLDQEEWITLLRTVEDSNALVVLDILILLKSMAMDAFFKTSEENMEGLKETKTYLIERLSSNPAILDPNICNPTIFFFNLDKNQYKLLAKSLVKLYFSDNEAEIFNSDAVTNNRLLLNALLLEVARIIAKCLQNCDDFSKALSKEVQMAAFTKEVDIKAYFNGIRIEGNSEEKIKQCIELMNILQIAYLEENYQLTAVFLLLVIKKCCQSKKIRKSIDCLLQIIFELSIYPPDLYKVFPVDFIFCFEDAMLLDLLTLKIKTSNQQLVIKNLIESAVKRVKVESDLVKSIVELLLKESSKNANTMEAFGDPKFQIICLILPLLVKQRKVITVSASRSILADLQEKLHKPLLDTFKSADFSQAAGNIASGNNTSVAGNTEDSILEDNMAILNATAAYSLTISKYCESSDVEDIKNLDCLLSGLEFFVDSAIQTIKNPVSRSQHIESSIQLLIITLRHIKKLEKHNIFNERDTLFTNFWLSINERLLKVFENEGSAEMCSYLDDMGMVLKSVFELVSVDCFVNKFVEYLASFVVLRSPSAMIKDVIKSDIILHSVSKYLWTVCLKANTTGPRCSAITRLMHQTCNNLKTWIRQHYEYPIVPGKAKLDVPDSENIVPVDNVVCEVIKIDLDTLIQAIYAGKRITIDYKFLDSIFELQHLVHHILGFDTPHVKCYISWYSFFTLFDSAVGILNSLLVSREEILEDRWPCLMQCYRALISTLCSKASTHTPLEFFLEEKLAENAYSIEKLTQSISKRRKQVTQIAAYTIADICYEMEKHAPSRMVRQHMQNSITLLIQASDSTHGMALLKRVMTGSIGQATLMNLYTMYKRNNKFTGDS